jgi:hypothetical protein
VKGDCGCRLTPSFFWILRILGNLLCGGSSHCFGTWSTFYIFCPSLCDVLQG